MSSMQQNAMGAQPQGSMGQPQGDPTQQLAQILGVTPEQAQRIIQMLPQICQAMSGQQSAPPTGGQEIPTTMGQGQTQESHLFNESIHNDQDYGTMQGMYGTGPNPGYGMGMGGQRQGMGGQMGTMSEAPLGKEEIQQYINELVASGMPEHQVLQEVITMLLERGQITEEEAMQALQTPMEQSQSPMPGQMAMPDSRKVNLPWRDSVINDSITKEIANDFGLPLWLVQQLVDRVRNAQFSTWGYPLVDNPNAPLPFAPQIGPYRPGYPMLDPSLLRPGIGSYTPGMYQSRTGATGNTYRHRTPSRMHDSKNTGTNTLITDSINLHIETDSVKESEGMLMAKVIATAAMVQDYNGKKVLKHPDHLKKAINFCRSIPITDQHPKEKIVMSQDEIKGWTSEPIWDEKKNQIHFSIMVMDKKLIDKIKAGNTDVSVGFFCDLEEVPGTWNDSKYDAIQTNIVMNHLAAGLKPGDGRCPTGTCGVILEEPALDTTKENCDICGIEKYSADCCLTKAKSKAPNSDTKTETKEEKKMTEDTKTKEPEKSEAETTDEEEKKEVPEETKKLVDSIMDFNPPKPREHYEKLSLDSLTEVHEVLKSTSMTTISGSSTGRKTVKAIDDAYAELEENLRKE